MVENTVECETQPGPRKRPRTLDERILEMQRLITAAKEIVGGNDRDAAELILSAAEFGRPRMAPLDIYKELEGRLNTKTAEGRGVAPAVATRFGMNSVFHGRR